MLPWFSFCLMQLIWSTISTDETDHCSSADGSRCLLIPIDGVCSSDIGYAGCAPRIHPDESCANNGGKCVVVNNICVCQSAPATRACKCVAPQDGAKKECIDNNCADARGDGYACVANTYKECRCKLQCDLPNAWSFCSPSNCRSCTSCDLFLKDSNTIPTNIDFDLCKEKNSCLFDGKLCVKPACIPPNEWRYCPQNDCRHCTPCKEMIPDGVTNAQCNVDNCKYNDFPCVFNECQIPIGWDLCDVNGCHNCKSCDDRSVACDDTVKCEMTATKARCIRQTNQIIRGDGWLWQYIKSDYTSIEQKKAINTSLPSECNITNTLIKDWGDLYENMATEELINGILPMANRTRICDECCNKTTVYKTLLCVSNNVHEEIKNKRDCVCEQHASVVYHILMNCDCIRQRIVSSDMVVKDRAGHYEAHAFNRIEYRDENGKACTMYIDSLNTQLTLSGDCSVPTEASTASIPTNSTQHASLAPGCILSPDICNVVSCNYKFVNQSMSSSLATTYCQNTYGTSLATVNTIHDVMRALFDMEGDEAWIDACDGNVDTCFDECMWIDGYSQNISAIYNETWNSINSSWNVVLYREGYIDIELSDIEMPFLCDCT